MPYQLSGLRLNRVDLCPAGANQGAEIVLFKSRKEADVPAPKKKVAAKKTAPAKKSDTRSKTKQRGEDEEEEEEDDVLKSEDEDEEEDVEKADDDEDDVEDEDVEEEDEDDEEDEKPAKKSKTKTASKTKTKKTVKTAKAKTADEDTEDDDAVDDEDTDLDETVLKSLPLSVQKSILRSQRIAKEALATANVEKDRRITLEFVEKAKAEVPFLPGTADENGEMLKAIHSGQPIEKKMAVRIVKALKAGNKAMESLMSTVGKRAARGEDDDSAASQLEEKRDEIIKANPKMTKEQAMAKAVDENPALYKAYRVEKARDRRHADVN